MTYTYRPINFDTDFDTYYKLYEQEYIEQHGGFNVSETEARAELEMPKFNMATDTYGAFTADGTLVGYGGFFALRELNVRPGIYGYVLPEYRKQGIGTKIMQWSIERAKQLLPDLPEDARLVLQTWAMIEPSKQLFEKLGFSSHRKGYQMHIEFDEAQPEVTFPDGIEVVTYADHPVLEDFVRIQQTAFRDHRGAVEEPLETVVGRWRAFIEAAEDFTPELLVMLREGDKDVGVIMIWPASEEDAEMGYIDIVGIMPDYRRRGLGLKLLRYAFHQLYTRGVMKAALGVDASSLTNATRLYEKAGMHIAKVDYAYEYEIRAGVEYSNQGQNQTETVTE